MGSLRQRGMRARLFLSHLLVIAAGSATLLLVTLITAPRLHDQLMLGLLRPGHGADDAAMAAMEQATNAVFQTAMLQALLLSGGAASVVAVGLSLLVSARIVGRVRHMLAASQRIAQGHYAERVPAPAATSSPRSRRPSTRWPQSWRPPSGAAWP